MSILRRLLGFWPAYGSPVRVAQSREGGRPFPASLPSTVADDLYKRRMAPATGTALLILVAFVLPGFITLVAREATYVVRDAVTPFERLLLSLSYSARIYGILLLTAFVVRATPRDIAALYRGERPLSDYLLLGTAALLILPIAISELGRRWDSSLDLRPRLMQSLDISPTHATRSSWDHFFDGDVETLILLTLDDERVIGGYFGQRSMAAYTGAAQDIFLERQWELDDDGWFLHPTPSSLGMWVPHRHIVSVEMYRPDRGIRTRTIERSDLT